MLILRGTCCTSHRQPWMDPALLLTTFMLLPADSSSEQSPAVEAARGPQHQPVQNKASERATVQSDPSSSTVETTSDIVQQRLPITHTVPHQPSQSAQPAEAGHSTRSSSKDTAETLPGLIAQGSVRATWRPAPVDQHTASAAEHGQAPTEEPVPPAEALPAEGPSRPGKKGSKHKHRSCKQQCSVRKFFYSVFL